MNHVEEGTIQAFLDAELEETERYTVERHLAACTTCASDLRSLREMDREFRSAMAQLDVPAPVADPLRSRRAALVFGVIPVQLARAALLALAVVGAVSAAIPGSPLRRWIEDVFLDEPEAAPQGVPQPVVPVPAPVTPPVDAQLPRGVGPVFPSLADGRITIHLHDPAPGVEVRVRLIDADGEAAVSWSDDSESVRRETSSGEFHLYGVTVGVVTIEIPLRARLADVEVDSVSWWRFEQGAGITVTGPSTRTSGNQTTFRVRN
jgi:hypothetical protein